MTSFTLYWWTISLTAVKWFGLYVVGLKVLQGQIIKIDYKQHPWIIHLLFFLFGASIKKSLNYMSKERSESLRNCFLLKPAGQLFTPMEKTWSCLDHCKCKNCQPKKTFIFIHLADIFIQCDWRKSQAVYLLCPQTKAEVKRRNTEEEN